MIHPEEKITVQPSGIYIHIPFCLRKCCYCDFYSITDLSIKDKFVNSLIAEMSMIPEYHFQFDTLYIGGGTPSLLDAKDIYQIINSAYHRFNIIPDTEITIEVNPGTVKYEQMKDYCAMGINRINIGVQSFQDKYLKFLTRIHSAEAAHKAVRNTRKAGFENIGIDLIYGIPGQSEKSWLSDLQTAVECNPSHLSCYMLTYESGTPLDNEQKKGNIKALSEDVVAHLFEFTVSFLEDYGYIHYEISNFARSPSEMSRHNRKYWSFIPYLGLGPSAHSFISPVRYWNYRSVKEYIHTVQSGKLPIEGKEILTGEQQIMEAICVGLRKTEGIDLKDFKNRFGISFYSLFGKITKELESEGFIKADRDCCMLSRKGMLFLDSISTLFVISDN